MRKYLFWPYQLYAWLIFVPFTGLFTLLMSWLVVVAALVISPRFASRYLGGAWARTIAFMLPVSVTVEGGDNVEPGRSFVVVANHASQIDILALYGFLDLDLKWVIKKELRRLPGVGYGCEKIGHIFVDRQNPELARLSVNEALSRLGDGIGILFFAEGTRSLDGRLLPFKKGAFRIAIDADLPILPVTVIGTRDILPAKTLRLFPGKVRVVVHPAIEQSGMELENMRELMARTRAAIASALPVQLRD